MSTRRASNVRGGLVCAFSALGSTIAHGQAGGAPPRGWSFALLVVACAAVGAAASCVSPGSHRRQLAFISALLAGGQLAGHLALGAAVSAAPASGHFHHPVHHHESMLPPTGPDVAAAAAPTMLLAHAVAAVGIGLLITLAERLYLAAASLVRRLRAFAVVRCGPVVAAVCRYVEPALVHGLLLGSGQGTRAPPSRLVCA